MNRIKTLRVLGFSIFVSVFTSSPVYAQTASALVLEKNGSSVPEVKPYSEILVGRTVSLQPGAKLVFVHYYTCQTGQ